MTQFYFKPSFLVRNKHLQTIINSKKRPTLGEMINCEQLLHLKVKVDAGDEVHLNGYYSAQIQKPSKGLVILLHGWLGSANSTYMLARGERLYQEGYDIFRLNLRDHGETITLNQGIFHGCRLEETVQAVKKIAALKPNLPIIILGFSMGGSFALRIAWQLSLQEKSIQNLKKIVAVCPSINLDHVMDAIDKSSIYRRYFYNKWRKNLIEKQHHFPEIYNFSDMLSTKYCKKMTEILIKNYSEFPDLDAYFTEYQFSKEKLKAVRIPMTVLTSADDPIIPIKDFTELKEVNPLFDLHVTRYGGHIGYIHSISGDSWLDTILPSLMV